MWPSSTQVQAGEEKGGGHSCTALGSAGPVRADSAPHPAPSRGGSRDAAVGGALPGQRAQTGPVISPQTFFFFVTKKDPFSLALCRQP